MKKRASGRFPRKARIALDLLLTAVLLLIVYIAVGCPAFGEEAEFRRAEQAAMLGPSVILDRYFTEPDWPWPSVAYDLTIVGDDGDAILFYTYCSGRRTTEMDGWITRCEKKDGLLLTTIPSSVILPYSFSDEREEATVPLLLFADDPDAVKATVELRLPNGETRTMTQLRGHPGNLDKKTQGPIKEHYFRFALNGDRADWDSWMYELMRTNMRYSYTDTEFPATIRLYDSEGRLLRTAEVSI